MNEQIKGLAEQAFIITTDGKIGHVNNHMVEKFAELIVRECAEIAKSTDPSDGDDYRSGRYWAGLDIKKHFGVE